MIRSNNIPMMMFVGSGYRNTIIRIKPMISDQEPKNVPSNQSNQSGAISGKLPEKIVATGFIILIFTAQFWFTEDILHTNWLFVVLCLSGVCLVLFGGLGMIWQKISRWH